MLRMVSRLICRQPCAKLAPKLGHANVLPQAARSATLSALRPNYTPMNTMRSISVSASTKSSALAGVIQEELEYERQNNESKMSIPEPPSDWKLVDEPGSALIKLERNFQGEKIVLELSVSEQAEALEEPFEENEDLNEDEEATMDVSIQFDVTITKGNRELQFELTSDGAYLEIGHVALMNTDEDVDEIDAYDGPDFQELDDRLQLAFKDYLKERGIDENLGDYLLQLADVKEQKEYVSWMKNLEVFIRK